MGKILFISGNLERGGAQRVLSILANSYAQKGWSTGIAVLLNDCAGYETDSRIKIYSLVRTGSYLKNICFWIIRLRALIKREKPDAVVSFVGRVNMIAMAAAAGLKVPVIVSERNDPANDRRSAPEVSLCKMFYRRADKVIFQTRYQQQFYGKTCRNNSAIIGNPIAAPIYLGEHTSNDIVAVGKLMRQKNHSMLIEAFATIADAYPQTKVHIFGEGELKDELQKLIDSYGLHEQIILEGNTDRIFEQLHKHRYFVMCSDYEGMSNALLEAMMSGMVCITTRWNGVEDIVKDGENGILVPCGDTAALAQTLRTVLSDSDMISDLNRNAIESAAVFQQENIFQLWGKTIEETINNKYER